MEELSDFISDFTDGISEELSSIVNNAFAELYVDYEMNPTHKNLNNAVTSLYDVFHDTQGINENIGIPTLEYLMDSFCDTIKVELPELYAEDFDFLENYDDFEDEEFSQATEIPLDYRIPNIRSLIDELRPNLACELHQSLLAAQAQVFDTAMLNKSEWDYEVIGDIFESVFNNLQSLRVVVMNHRRANGMEYIE
uniref:Protein phosphatase CheZ n=1 Tax=Caenorhabditis tropicalis TaxID=1561998 RepID=A0A1I7US86_9PELO